jgi:hypothetical protein
MIPKIPLELRRRTKINTLISYILMGLLVYVFVHEIVLRQHAYAVAALAAIAISLSPALIKHNYRISIPWYLEFLVVFSLLLHIAGNSFRLYDKIWYYDIIMHLLGSVVIALLGFLAVFVLHYTGKIKVSLRLIGFFTFIFAVAIGALWEISEFSIDHALRMNAQMTWIDPAAGLYDTNMDMIFDSIAGALVAIGGMLYVKGTSQEELEENIRLILVDSERSKKAKRQPKAAGRAS